MSSMLASAASAVLRLAGDHVPEFWSLHVLCSIYTASGNCVVTWELAFHIEGTAVFA